ncbi:DNA-processing protein DprA [Phenylobacterium sp.]|uniref:DNA-processing protein DprA n=1 Tax=Phenylobacterium sp. TaxID=1871053 RepID=UPI002730D692|nr:DNA-processing protein DprA [Phenylobacterium sp.]MDP1874002.1 DNA-processing protein DprA [Phenylobacterium sp.]MDP3488823.1 DNA-processing protein DprA [Phenylobacterium sp.]
MTQALSPEARRDWLRLARAEGVGPVTFDQLIRRYAEPGRALEALPELARRGGRSRPPAIPTIAAAEAELAAGEALGAQLICACDPDYPQALAALDPPPPLLWARGDASLLDRSIIAIVGARVASAAGQRFARGLAAELGQTGHVVVSGMARGIDGAAHEGSLEHGAIAVLGGGIDDIYPPEHRDLYHRLVAEGCVVAEHPPGRQAQARDFPRRNRIIAGLSRAVVVVEAELRSGSLITARLAAEQGREVLAVPGSPLDPRARGTNDLIRQGAALCEGVSDVLRALETLGGLADPGAAFKGAAVITDSDAALTEKVAALLSPTPVSRDELVRATGREPGAVAAALVELALAGRAELLPGGMAATA